MRGALAAALTDFSGGLNLREAPWDVRNEESPLLLDFQPVGFGGAIIARVGDASVSNWSGVAAGDFGSVIFKVAEATPASPHLFVQLLSGKLLDLDVNAGTVVVDAGPYASGDSFALVQAPATGGQGPYYFTTPATPRVARQSTGGGTNAAWTATAGTVPIAYLMIYHGNRVWAARTAAMPDGVWWSELGDPRNWPAANVNRFGVGDGEEIRAIAPIGPNILVFKESRAWLIYDLDTGANRPLGAYGSVGSLVLETPYGLVFEDPARGICITDGARVDTIGDLIGGGSIGGAAYVDDSLFVTHSVNFGGGLTADLFEYRFKNKTWWAHRAPGLRDLVASENALYGVRSTDTKLWGFGQGTTAIDGSALAPRWRSKFLRLGDSQIAKRIRSIEFAGEGTLSVIARKNQESTVTSTSGPYALPTANDSNRQAIPDLGVAYSLQLEFLGSGTDRQRLDELTVRTFSRRD